MHKKRSAYRKAQYWIEFAAFIAIFVVSLIAMQNYFKRGMQGQMQLAADQMANPYQARRTNLQDDFGQRSVSFEVTTAGINNPTTITFTKGSYQSDSQRTLALSDQ